MNGRELRGVARKYHPHGHGTTPHPGWPVRQRPQARFDRSDSESKHQLQDSYTTVSNPVLSMRDRYLALNDLQSGPNQSDRSLRTHCFETAMLAVDPGFLEPQIVACCTMDYAPCLQVQLCQRYCPGTRCREAQACLISTLQVSNPSQEAVQPAKMPYD